MEENFYSNFLIAVRKIQKRKLYTYVAFDSYGMPFISTIRVSYIRCVKEEEYSIVGPVKGKWNRTFINISPSKQFVMWEGVVNVNVSPIVVSGIADSDQGHLKVSKKWPGWDARYLHRAIASIAMVAPLIYNIRPLGHEVLLTTQAE